MFTIICSSCGFHFIIQTPEKQRIFKGHDWSHVVRDAHNYFIHKSVRFFLWQSLDKVVNKNMAHSHGYKERSETVTMPLLLGEHDFVTFTIPQSSTVNPIVVVVFAFFTTKSLPHQWSQLCKNMSPSMTASVRLPLHPWQTLQPRSIPFVLCLCQYTEALVDGWITCHSNSP
jgi:hypothetical protein